MLGPSPPAGSCQLTRDQKGSALLITSMFENSAFRLVYEYCEGINDHRGYTYGAIGFCTNNNACGGETGRLFERYLSGNLCTPNSQAATIIRELKAVRNFNYCWHYWP